MKLLTLLNDLTISGSLSDTLVDAIVSCQEDPDLRPLRKVKFDNELRRKIKKGQIYLADMESAQPWKCSGACRQVFDNGKGYLLTTNQHWSHYNPVGLDSIVNDWLDIRDVDRFNKETIENFKRIAEDDVFGKQLEVLVKEGKITLDNWVCDAIIGYGNGYLIMHPR